MFTAIEELDPVDGVNIARGFLEIEGKGSCRMYRMMAVSKEDIEYAICYPENTPENIEKFKAEMKADLAENSVF